MSVEMYLPTPDQPPHQAAIDAEKVAPLPPTEEQRGLLSKLHDAVYAITHPFSQSEEFRREAGVITPDEAHVAQETDDFEAVQNTDGSWTAVNPSEQLLVERRKALENPAARNSMVNNRSSRSAFRG